MVELRMMPRREVKAPSKRLPKDVDVPLGENMPGRDVAKEPSSLVRELPTLMGLGSPRSVAAVPMALVRDPTILAGLGAVVGRRPNGSSGL